MLQSPTFHGNMFEKASNTQWISSQVSLFFSRTEQEVYFHHERLFQKTDAVYHPIASINRKVLKLVDDIGMERNTIRHVCQRRSDYMQISNLIHECNTSIFNMLKSIKSSKMNYILKDNKLQSKEINDTNTQCNA